MRGQLGASDLPPWSRQKAEHAKEASNDSGMSPGGRQQGAVEELASDMLDAMLIERALAR